jgi:DNA-binding SARP family transcriptional activator
MLFVSEGRAVHGYSSAPAFAASGILICLLGGFRVLKLGRPIPLRAGGKAEQLLGTLALGTSRGVPREDLLEHIWPDSEHSLAVQSLNTLVYSLHRTLGDALAGRPPVVPREGAYCLNTEAGIAIDVVEFDAAARSGDRLALAGDRPGAIDRYQGALFMYGGDLAFGSDIKSIVERERLRSRHLSVLARLADSHFADGNFAGALDGALQLLAHDPCREDAHRMAMRCFVRLGARAQALRQFRTCRAVLQMEFEALPERSTEQLYEAVRVEPWRV